MNVILELQRRQWRQVEDWGTTRLCQFAEERALFRLRDSVGEFLHREVRVRVLLSGAVGVS